MENKFKEGTIVFAKVKPNQKLIIRRYVDGIYYCKIEENVTLKELVFFERELIAVPEKSIEIIT